jgi:hypothetical protein
MMLPAGRTRRVPILTLDAGFYNQGLVELAPPK